MVYMLLQAFPMQEPGPPKQQICNDAHGCVHDQAVKVGHLPIFWVLNLPYIHMHNVLHHYCAPSCADVNLKALLQAGAGGATTGYTPDSMCAWLSSSALCMFTPCGSLKWALTHLIHCFALFHVCLYVLATTLRYACWEFEGSTTLRYWHRRCPRQLGPSWLAYYAHLRNHNGFKNLQECSESLGMQKAPFHWLFSQAPKQMPRRGAHMAVTAIHGHSNAYFRACNRPFRVPNSNTWRSWLRDIQNCL